jgi:hypothetical protein
MNNQIPLEELLDQAEKEKNTLALLIFKLTYKVAYQAGKEEKYGEEINFDN